MIIKIIPETDEERNRFNECFSTNEIVHSGVREYFVFGNKEVIDNQVQDFHEWSGSPRYLMGNLRYFFEVVNDERRLKESNGQSVPQHIPTQNNNKVQKLQFPNKINSDIPQNPVDLENELGKLNHPKVVMENRSPKIVKRGDAGNIQPIDISNLKNGKNNAPVPNVPRVDMFPNVEPVGPIGNNEDGDDWK